MYAEWKHITRNKREKKNYDIPGVFSVSAADYKLKYVCMKQNSYTCWQVCVCVSHKVFLFL